MRLIGKYLYGAMMALALLGGAACSGEEPLPEPEPTPIVPQPEEEDDGILDAVTITFGASNTIETRAFNGDPNANEHEFMHSLIAFIVNDDTIEAVIHPTDLDPEGTGNVNLYSEEVDITPGTKTIYAFANMDNVKRVGATDETSFLTTLEALKVGDTWLEAYETAVIEDPAATVNLSAENPEEMSFIPMSLKEEVTVTVSGQSISLYLVRLVSRVSVQLCNRQGTTITVKNFTMSDFADRVNLFESGNAPTVIEEYKSYPFDEDNTSGETGIPIDHNTTVEIASFYINETLSRTDTKPFALSLKVGEKEMTGATTCASIPRNHILPLTLNLSDTYVGLKVEAQVAPIGGYPVNVYLRGDGFLPVNGNVGKFAVALPEGCHFSVTGTIEGSSGTSTPITGWTWTNGSPSLCALTETKQTIDGETVWLATSNPITGHLTALPEQKVKLNFSITAPVAGEGSLTIETAAVGDAPWSENKAFGPVESEALRSWSQPVRWREFIPLRMANPE